MHPREERVSENVGDMAPAISGYKIVSTVNRVVGWVTTLLSAVKHPRFSIGREYTTARGAIGNYRSKRSLNNSVP